MKQAIIVSLLLLLSGQALAQSATDTKETKLLNQAKTLYTKSKASFVKTPKDAKAKKSYIDATVSYGTIAMNSPVLKPKDKYPLALRLYREALKIDPKNEVALNNRKMIESIYKSMNRPVPQ